MHHLKEDAYRYIFSDVNLEYLELEALITHTIHYIH